MITTEQFIDDDAETKIAALHAAAAARSGAAIDDAVRRLGATMAALQAASPAIVEAIRAVIGEAIRLGAAIAARGAALLRSRRRSGRAPARPVKARDLAGRVRDILSGAARALSGAPDRDHALQEIERVKGQVRAYASVVVHGSAAAAAEQVARRLGADGVIWIAGRASCLNCRSLCGQIARLDEPFSAHFTLGDRPLRWRGFTGRPPRHPNCNCRVVPWFDNAAGWAAQMALQSEVRQSIALGFAGSTGSARVRARAARRFLARSPRLPGSDADRFFLNRHRRAGAGRRSN